MRDREKKRETHRERDTHTEEEKVTLRERERMHLPPFLTWISKGKTGY